MNKSVFLLLFCALNVLPAQAQKAKTDANKIAGRDFAQRLSSVSNWQDLFNGTDLTGWSGDTDGYVVEDNKLVCKKGGKNLRTAKQYSDFVFEFEFKLEESGNNGVGIRVPEGGHPAQDGMEIQILDHNGSRYNGVAEMDGGKKRKLSWLKPWQYHGSIYGITPAKTGYLNPVGEWNKETIVAIEDHIMVIVNDAVIVDAFLDETTPVDGGQHPGMKNAAGHIMLAGHSDRVEFRNLRIADCSASAPLPKSDKDNSPPEGFANLFNGTDLTGWKGLAHKNANERRKLSDEALVQAQQTADKNMAEHWSVIDGILTYDGKGQSLSTAKDYGDFEMYIDWKIPSGADSGIYLRGTPQIQIWDPWSVQKHKYKAPPTNAKEFVADYKNGQNLGSGGLWNNKCWRNSPTTLADKPIGQWNTFFIRMVGDKVSIWLNKKQIVNRVKLENYWDKTGLTPIPRADQIELQHHGSELYFKNIYIRELPY
ncbi:3-keto-disaccharide hydrolase [Planctomycetes bacterium K23_9]|uniref:3-keto-alpha-glucoside-1,2-lyase/3-keto-2-hydroxy-glucal hydratase domain-containing protein n=1 Tax=Stieleria marina TaxID=1930275 RepID=A0A517P1D6_9BACT|nr:hypothetical protein K239x_52030 [Planctomycetes bacterium K23_9]